MNLKKKKNISHYAYPCYISLKNKDMFPGKKKVRGFVADFKEFNLKIKVTRLIFKI